MPTSRSKSVVVDSGHPPRLSEGGEVYTLNYRLIHGEAADDLARLVRSFTPSTSRIFPDMKTGILRVTDTGASLRRIYFLIRENDVVPTPEMKTKWQEMEKRQDSKREPDSSTDDISRTE